MDSLKCEPFLLPDENRRWGLPDGRCGHADQDGAIASMCNHGAERFNEGYCEIVNFDCMPGEVDQIRQFMAKNHPDVKYCIGSARRALSLAYNAWRAQQHEGVHC